MEHLRGECHLNIGDSYKAAACFKAATIALESGDPALEALVKERVQHANPNLRYPEV